MGMLRVSVLFDSLGSNPNPVSYYTYDLRQDLTLLSLSFPICKIRLLTALVSSDYVIWAIKPK